MIVQIAGFDQLLGPIVKPVDACLTQTSGLPIGTQTGLDTGPVEGCLQGDAIVLPDPRAQP